MKDEGAASRKPQATRQKSRRQAAESKDRNGKKKRVKTWRSLNGLGRS
jgi:hypothetical protein